MSDTPARSLRLPLAEVLQRLASGEPILFLDARSQKAIAESNLRIPGSVRIRPVLLQVDPSWDADQLTIVYCA